MALWHDVRYAARLLVKDRWFTIVAAVALALGIGVNATVFTFVNAVLLRGLPFDHPDRIMWVGTRNAQRQERALSILDFEDWRARATLLDHLVLWQSFAFNVSDPGREPDRFPGVYISLGHLQGDWRAADPRPRLPSGGRQARGAAGRHHRPQPLAKPLRR